MSIIKNRRKEDRRRKSGNLIVSDIIKDKTGHISTIKDTATLTECAKVMTFMKVGVLIALDSKDRFVGTVSERAVVHAFGKNEEHTIDLTVADIISDGAATCTRDTDLNTVLDTMKDQGIRHVPVMEDDQVTGIVSISDILRHYL